MYRYEFAPLANERLDKLARRNPQQARAILRKIRWLAEHADEIAHQPIKGSPYFSLHSGFYRIPYRLDPVNRVIRIEDIAQHDAAYNRINRLRD